AAQDTPASAGHREPYAHAVDRTHAPQAVRARRRPYARPYESVRGTALCGRRRRAAHRRHAEHDPRRPGRNPRLPGVARAGAAERAGRPVRHQVVRGRVRDLDRDHVTRAGRLVADREVDQPVVGGAAGHPAGGVVLAALALGDQDLQREADLLPVLLPGDLVLEGDQPLVALLADFLRDLG